MRTSRGDALTQVLLAVFRLNGRLLATGDELSAPERLSSARWQVLGALAGANRPLTMPQIARRMGLARQSVHATVKPLVADGLLEFVDNVDHQRSQLVQPTADGLARLDAVDARQAEWVNRLANGLDEHRLLDAADLLTVLIARLEEQSLDM
jgi:DNA-binding MarR family transcriptional regulator